MGKQSADIANRFRLASAEEVRRILGVLDGEKLVDVMTLRPTTKEEASPGMVGDADVSDAGKPRKSTAGRIVEILAADDDEERKLRSFANARDGAGTAA
jgi:hypothetical protein